FSCNAAWQEVRHSLPKVAWADIVWFPDSIPKHRFCLWLSFHNAHKTTNKLRAYGVVADNVCVFGCGGLESIDHLFFGCKFTAKIWNQSLRKYVFHRICRLWLEEAISVTERLKGRGFKGWISRFTLASMVYFC
ncbi:zf-RVT domain-containing protein, partial [Cephalotus follicularis]